MKIIYLEKIFFEKWQKPPTRAFAWFARGSARGPSKTREEEPSEPRKHGFVGRKINVAFLLALVAIAGPPGGAKKAEQINDHDSTFCGRCWRPSLAPRAAARCCENMRKSGPISWDQVLDQFLKIVLGVGPMIWGQLF